MPSITTVDITPTHWRLWLSTGLSTYLDCLGGEREHAHDALCVFSQGSRGCVRKDLAYTELAIAGVRFLFSLGLREAVASRWATEGRIWFQQAQKERVPIRGWVRVDQGWTSSGNQGLLELPLLNLRVGGVRLLCD